MCTRGSFALYYLFMYMYTFSKGGGGRDRKSAHPSFLLLFITHWLGTEIISAWTVSGVYPTGIYAKFTCYLHVWRPPK